MRDFDSAKELFKDTIDPSFYFDSMSAEVARNKIEEAILERYASLIFVIGDPGVGKTYILRLINLKISRSQLTVFIDHPFFDKRDLLKMLYDAKGLYFNKETNFNILKDELIKEYEGVHHTIFIDEAQLLNEEQLELIRILSDTKVFQFVLSMHQEEGALILEKKHFKSRTKVVVEYGKLDHKEILRYIQSSLIAHSHGEIATMFTPNIAKKINHYTKGNFRTIKKFLYILMRLLAYAKKNGLTKYQKINYCLLKMVDLDINFLSIKNNTFEVLEAHCSQQRQGKILKVILIVISLVVIVLGYGILMKKDSSFLFQNNKAVNEVKTTIQDVLIEVKTDELNATVHEKKSSEDHTTEDVHVLSQEENNSTYDTLILTPKIKSISPKVQVPEEENILLLPPPEILNNEENQQLELLLKKPEGKKQLSMSVSSLSQEEALLKNFHSAKTFAEAIALTHYYFEQKEYLKVILWAKESSKLKPSSVEPWLLYAKSKFYLGEKEEAIRSLELFLSYTNSKEAKELLTFYKGQQQ